MATLALGLLGSQAGHLLAYQVRFGAAAQQLQSAGAHAYFPGVARTALGLLAAIVLAGLLVVGLARAIGGHRLVRAGSAPSLLRLVAALFTIQLAVFVAQETAEAAASGVQGGSIPVLLLWGSLGQLPVALVGAVALRWLLMRFDAAVQEIRVALSAQGLRARFTGALAPVLAGTQRDDLHPRVAGASVRKRGPPPFPLFTSK